MLKRVMPSRVEARLEVTILVACALVFVFLAYERGVSSGKPRTSVYSTYDTGPNGYRALYEVLRAAGVPLTRFGRELPLLDPSVQTIVITGYEEDPSAKPLDARDAAWLRDFVTKGGRLVAIDAEFAGADDIAPGVGITVRKSTRDAIPLSRNAYTAGVSHARGSIDWVFPFKERQGTPLLANASGMVAVLYRVGRGQVVAVTAPALFGNAQLRYADNVRFAYNAISGHGEAVFDEYVHGYSDGAALWQVLPVPVRAAVWIVVALVVIGLIGANIPFAPPYSRGGPDERDSSHFITALAELMRRSRRRPYDDDVVWQATVDYRQRKEHA